MGKEPDVVNQVKFIFRYKQNFKLYHVTVFSEDQQKARARLGVLSLTHDEFLSLKRALQGKDAKGVSFIPEKGG